LGGTKKTNRVKSVAVEKKKEIHALRDSKNILQMIIKAKKQTKKKPVRLLHKGHGLEKKKKCRN